MISIDEKKIERAQVLDHLITLDENYRWDGKGITIEYGEKVGSTGWKVSTTGFRFNSTRNDLNDALDDILAQLEKAFAVKIQQMDQRVALMKKLGE